MMAKAEPLVHVGEFGFIFAIHALEFQGDVASAEIRFRKPSGFITSAEASPQGDMGRIWGFLVEDDLFNEAGSWRAQLFLTLTSGQIIPHKRSFDVGSVIPAPPPPGP